MWARRARADTLVPVFLFPLYAVIVGLLVAKFRRRWQGFAITLLAVALVALVGVGHWWLGVLSDGRLQVDNMRIILIGYGLLIGAMGTFIACLGHQQPWHCQFCGYNLLGHAEHNPMCPECGRKSALKAFGRGRCRYCGLNLHRRHEDPTAALCTTCRRVMLKSRALIVAGKDLATDQAIERAQHEHDERHPGDQRHPQRREAPIVHLVDDAERARRRALRDELIQPRKP